MVRMHLSRNTTWHVKINEDQDENPKFSRELREEDVVYRLNYRKVFMHDSYDSLPDSNANSRFYALLPKKEKAIHRWKLEEIRTVKLATQDKLIHMLGSESGSIDSPFVSIYLSTYRSYLSTHMLVDKLLRKYCEYSMSSAIEEKSKSNYLKSLRTVVSIWTSKYKKDFYDPPKHKLYKHILSFFTTTFPCQKLAEKLSLTLTQLKDSSHDMLTFSGFQWKIPTPVNAFYHLDLLSAWEFAEQLTCIDADLFCRVYLPECLGSVWSKRVEERHRVRSVVATVEQFNHLTYRTIASILAPQDAQGRSRVIERWIDIAQELRYLKNFSSLKALTSALKSTAIYRLNKTWSFVDEKHLSIYDKLTTTMSDDDNQTVLREIMSQEGTSKFATVKMNTKIKSWLVSKGDELSYLSVGIVPYLGTFLTDLTMLHASQKNVVHAEGSDPMINFEKKRREHCILTQLSLLQTSCKLYNLNFHTEFYPLFLNLPSLNAQESYDISCTLEPSDSPIKTSQQTHQNTNNNTTKEQSNESTRVSKSEKGFCNPMFDWEGAVNNCWTFNSLQNNKKNYDRKMSTISTSGESKLVHGRLSKECIGKVYIEGVAGASHCSKYKSILVSRKDRTEDVILKSLSKYNVPSDITAFHLFQLLPNQPEILFEEGAPVLRCIQPCFSLEFLVKKKHHHPQPTYL